MRLKATIVTLLDGLSKCGKTNVLGLRYCQQNRHLLA